MSDVADQLKQRTMRFGLDACALIRELPRQKSQALENELPVNSPIPQFGIEG